VIHEYIRYTISSDRATEFENAYDQAAASLRASTHCLGYDLSRCIEDPTSYILQIEWASLDDHLKGFRQSEEFKSFFKNVQPFLQQITEMRHYELTKVAGHIPYEDSGSGKATG
jgi:quinol monooxygenase YgiN